LAKKKSRLHAGNGEDSCPFFFRRFLGLSMPLKVCATCTIHMTFPGTLFKTSNTWKAEWLG
jgi:hypothetical protein